MSHHYYLVRKNTKTLLVLVLLLQLIHLWPNVQARADGALAIDEKNGDQFGWAVDYDNLESARARALKECGRGCRIVLEFPNGCAAYYTDADQASTVYGWGGSNNEQGAKRIANRECRKRGANFCIARVWGCNSSQSRVQQENNERQVRRKNNVESQSDTSVKRSTSVGVKASLALVIDTSGSMSGSKLESAKKSAIENIKRVLSNGFEVSVISFGGECSGSPIKKLHKFSRDERSLINFVNSLSADGRTPLGNALEYVAQHVSRTKSNTSNTDLIVLLADGADSCDNVERVLDRLESKGQIFRHETIGLQVESDAASQLRRIARKTGGSYHSASNTKQLRSIFKEAIDTSALLDLIGKFK